MTCRWTAAAQLLRRRGVLEKPIAKRASCATARRPEAELLRSRGVLNVSPVTVTL
jgi:hypothetical protein